MPALTAWCCRSGKKEWREAASSDAVGSGVDMLAVAGDREAASSIAFCRACSASVHNHGTKETGGCGLAKPARTQASPG